MDAHSCNEVKGSEGKSHGHDHLVQVSIDGRHEMFHEGRYLVSDLKIRLGVPADYELDQVIHGEFVPLTDDAFLEIHHKMVFVSHVRRGGAS